MSNKTLINFIASICVAFSCVLAASQDVNPKALLSIDGGGIRGLIPLRVIEKVESVLGSPITDYVKIFSGTSTGGIIALGYASGLKTSDLINIYENDGDQIFYRSWSRIFSSFGGLTDEKYDSAPIEHLMKATYGEDKCLAHIKGFDAIVPAANITKQAPHVFTTYEARLSPQDMWVNLPLWYVARATSAAPTYFEAVKFKRDQALVDGGIIANNPTELAYAVCKKQYGIEAAEHMKVISLGTGHSSKGIGYSKAKDMGVLDWAAPISSTMMNTTTSLTNFLMQQQLPPSQYLRINPLLEEKIALDSVSQKDIQVLNNAAEAFIEAHPELIESFVAMLREIKL